MGNPYTSQSISGYNTSPPSDDGTQTEANRVKYATTKTKLTDPVKTLAEAIDTELLSAFGKIAYNGVTTTATNYTILSTDQGKLIRVTASVTITTPAAATVGTPFMFAVKNEHTAGITIDGNGSETIDGAASITLGPNATVSLMTDGTNWFTVTSYVPSGMILLASATPSAASSVDFTSGIDSTYKRYVVIGDSLIPATDGADLYVRTDANGGASFDAGATDYEWASRHVDTSPGGANNTDNADTEIHITSGGVVPSVGNATNEGVSFTLEISDPANAAIYTRMFWRSAYVSDDATPLLVANFGAGHRLAAHAVDAIRFLFSTGNIASGEIRLYGIREL